MTDVQTQPDATPITADVVSANGNKAGGATGTILQITGPVVDVQFPADMLPEIYNALEVTRDDGRHPHPGDAVAPRQRRGARHRDEHHRRSPSRRDSAGYGRPDHRPGRPGDARPHPQCRRRADRRGRAGHRDNTDIRSTGRRRASRTRRPRSRSSRPASRSSTSSPPSPRAARPASSAAPASARRSSSPS